jgi:hypothetical protein
VFILKISSISFRKEIMPIPASTSSDILLCELLNKQVEDFGAWISLMELKPVITNSAREDIQFLERHLLVEYRPATSQVRLTGLGVYTALLFEVL